MRTAKPGDTFITEEELRLCLKALDVLDEVYGLTDELEDLKQSLMTAYFVGEPEEDESI